MGLKKFFQRKCEGIIVALTTGHITEKKPLSVPLYYSRRALLNFPACCSKTKTPCHPIIKTYRLLLKLE